MTQQGKFAPLALGVVLGIGLLAGGTATALAAPTPATAGAAQQDNVLRATLANGLRVVIVKDDLAPTVTTQITYLAGGYQTPEGFPGTAHALEHMMFRNSKGLTGAQLNEMTGKMGARNNAFTTADATQYYFVAPSEYTDLLLKIESIRMRGAQLTDKDWGLERGAIEQEVSRDISNPDFLALVKARKILFAGTGYARDALGSRPTFDKNTGATLKKFYDQWYRPNNAIFVIAGDVDPQATLARVKQLFGAIPKADLPVRAPLKLQPFKPQTIRKTTPDATGTIQYLYRAPGQRSADYAAFQVLMDVINNARSESSDLAAQGKVLSSGAWSWDFAHASIGAISAGFPKGKGGSKAAAALDGVLNRLLEHGVSTELVEAAKRQERASFEFDRNSARSLASAWSQALAWRGLDSPRQALEQIENVSVDDVNRVLRKYCQPDQRVTIVLTPSADGKRPPNSQGFGGTEKFASNDKLDAPLPDWASKQLDALNMPHWTLDPVTMKLDNGITLIVQPESISKTVTVKGYVDTNSDLQAPEGQKGVGQLLDMLFSYGTQKFDRDTFHKALDEIAASESAGTRFSLAVPSAHFDRGMQLLAANELHPALPAKAFKVKQRTLSERLKGRLKSPRYKMMRALYEGLYPAGDPGLRQATPATVDSLGLADVKRYYQQVYRPDMTTIVVVGDVTPAEARAKVEKYFGGWTASGPKPDVVTEPVPVNPARYTVVPNPYASQDTVIMGQMMDLDIHNPDRYTLHLGNEVLGGNGFASRLMVDIRVKHGYAYGAGSGMSFGRSRSIFYVSYASDPDKVEPVDGLIHANLESMRTKPVKATELTNAKQAAIRSIPLGVSSVDAIARSLLNWSYKGLPLNEPMIAARHYLDTSAADIQAMFNKYVRPTNLVQVVQGPAPKQH